METPLPIIETPRSLLAAPRTLLIERFLDWLTRQPIARRLPAGEIVVTVTRGERVPRRYGRGAIGVFLAWLGPRRGNDRWEVVVSYGGALADAADLAAWLGTVPHELLHLAAFAAATGGRLPAALPLGWAGRVLDDEAAVEAEAEALVDAFLAAVPDALDDPRLLAAA